MLGDRIRRYIKKDKSNVIEGSPLFEEDTERTDRGISKEQAEKLKQEMNEAGGCCGVARTARHIRDNE